MISYMLTQLFEHLNYNLNTIYHQLDSNLVNL